MADRLDLGNHRQIRVPAAPPQIRLTALPILEALTVIVGLIRYWQRLRSTA
jgi:hypothetical protein